MQATEEDNRKIQSSRVVLAYKCMELLKVYYFVVKDEYGLRTSLRLEEE